MWCRMTRSRGPGLRCFDTINSLSCDHLASPGAGRHRKGTCEMRPEATFLASTEGYDYQVSGNRFQTVRAKRFCRAWQSRQLVPVLWRALTDKATSSRTMKAQHGAVRRDRAAAA